MYEGIPTKKKAPNEKSWAPKHKAVFGEEPRTVHESVFGKVGEDGKEKPTSDKELTDTAKVIRGNAPSAIHEKVFGKEERIKAPIHESVFGKDKSETKKEESVQDTSKAETTPEPNKEPLVSKEAKEEPAPDLEKERANKAEQERAFKEYLAFRSRFETGQTVRVRLERLTSERKLNLGSFKNAYIQALALYDGMYMSLAKIFSKDENDARIPVMEELRETLKSDEVMRANYEKYLASVMQNRREVQKKAA